MEIFHITAFISISVWVSLPIFHRKKNLFFFFLIYSALDFFGLMGVVVNSGVIELFIPFSFLTIAALNRNFFKKYAIYLIPIGLILLALTFNLEDWIKYSIDATMHIAISMVILSELTSTVLKSYKVNIFYCILLLYEFTNVLKLLVIIIDLETGLVYYIISTTFQILIGIFFIFFREDSKKLQVNILPKE